MAEIETKKKWRKVAKSSFTRTANELEPLLLTTVYEDTTRVLWELLSSKYEELKLLDNELFELLLENATEGELESELEGREAYFRKFTSLRSKWEKLDAASRIPQGRELYARAESTTGSLQSAENPGMRKFRLPTIEFKHYDGSIKDWLAFWAQFKKVHEDPFIDPNDEIEYLIQATVAGSRARQLVESYPAMGENYSKIIQSMQDRFGREDLQIEVYVRGLLRLVLSNSASREKLDVSVLYDSLETQLRALETLGITSDKYAAMLFPLIESCLPHELLRVWQRSTLFTIVNSSELQDDVSTPPLEIKLRQLMAFLKQEVDNEQRLVLAAEGFGLTGKLCLEKMGEGNARMKLKKSGGPECPTAIGLMNLGGESCLFCQGNHNATSCFKAQKMTILEKKQLVSKKGACFRCLKIGHQWRKCKSHLKCIVCSRSHVVLMCPELPSHVSIDRASSDKNIDSRIDSELVREHSLSNHTSSHVFLQTLCVILKGSNCEKRVRALIDTGSQRSYIKKAVAIQLGYASKRQEKVRHCLFGGSEVINFHDCYDITICKDQFIYKFEVLDQPTICADIFPMLAGPWLKEIKEYGLEMSDYSQCGPIELLLGADVAGVFYTGIRQVLPCGLIAFETHFGWTLMGKVPNCQPRSDTALTTLNLFVKDAQICNLWELDVLGIQDPVLRNRT